MTSQNSWMLKLSSRKQLEIFGIPAKITQTTDRESG